MNERCSIPECRCAARFQVRTSTHSTTSLYACDGHLRYFVQLMIDAWGDCVCAPLEPEEESRGDEMKQYPERLALYTVEAPSIIERITRSTPMLIAMAVLCLTVLALLIGFEMGHNLAITGMGMEAAGGIR